MSVRTRVLISAACVFGGWLALLLGWPSTWAACLAGCLGLIAVLLAPLDPP